MCARYVFYSGRSFGDEFGVVAIPDISPRYNIAPTQLVLGVVEEGGLRLIRPFQWGLVPSWSKDPNAGSKLINARSETISEKPSFRTAFKRRRCLIPADGFYEWKGPVGQKQPYYITCERCPFAFAGIWDHWEGVDGELDTCAIVTTSANGLMSQIHDRMPVILSRDEYTEWLSLDSGTNLLQSLMDSYPGELMSMHPVSKLVGNSKYDDASLIEEIAPTTLF